ncbi:hypothetical protein P9112_001508 [Eukaryota sp. TZLM1-RC]
MWDSKLYALIAEEEIVAGMTLAGIQDQEENNVFQVTVDTPVSEMESAFHRFVSNQSIQILIITSTAADKIRIILKEHDSDVPTIVEIPSFQA